MAFQSQQQEQESKTIPLKVLVDKHSNKVVFVKATKDFVNTLFSFLSLPLATIVRLLATTDDNSEQQKQHSESSQFLENIKNLYQTVENLNSNDVWNNQVCKHMLLHPKNPCESLCMDLFLNIDDAEPLTKFYACGFCSKITNYRNLACTCGKPANREIEYLGSDARNGAFVRESGPMFLVSDNLKIVSNSLMTSMQMLIESGISNSTQLEEVTHNIGEKQILNLLKYALTSHEPLTNTILASSSKIKDSPRYQSASAVKVMRCTSDKSKMDIKVLQSKSQKKIIVAEADGYFVDFIFSFLTMPLGSIVNLLGSNTFAGCVSNLYQSLENLDPKSVLLNPGIAPQFGCLNQPLDIPHLKQPSTIYYFDRSQTGSHFIRVAKSRLLNLRFAVLLNPRGGVGFVKTETLYGVGNDLKVKSISANSFLSYFKELSLPLDDLEVKVISFGEAEALRFLGAFLTSKFTLTSGLQDMLNVPKQESTLLKVPKQES